MKSGRPEARARCLAWQSGRRSVRGYPRFCALIRTSTPRLDATAPDDNPFVNERDVGSSRGVWYAMAEPHLQLEQRHRLLGVVELGRDRRTGAVSRSCSLGLRLIGSAWQNTPRRRCLPLQTLR